MSPMLSADELDGATSAHGEAVSHNPGENFCEDLDWAKLSNGARLFRCGCGCTVVLHPRFLHVQKLLA
eukprot:9477090-Pyramimonas_sp.AAC.1